MALKKNFYPPPLEGFIVARLGLKFPSDLDKVALLPELKKGISHEIEVATRGLEHEKTGNLLMVK